MKRVAEQIGHSYFKKGIEQGIEKGIERGRREGEAELLIELLEHRFGPLDLAYRQHILQANHETLLALSKKVLFADSLDAVI